MNNSERAEMLRLMAEELNDSISTYDITMLTSIAVYLIPTAFLLRKKKLSEVELYFGRDMK